MHLAPRHSIGTHRQVKLSVDDACRAASSSTIYEVCVYKYLHFSVIIEKCAQVEEIRSGV